MKTTIGCDHCKGLGYICNLTCTNCHGTGIDPKALERMKNANLGFDPTELPD